MTVFTVVFNITLYIQASAGKQTFHMVLLVLCILLCMESDLNLLILWNKANGLKLL